MAKRVLLISRSLRANVSFQSDLKRTFQLPPERIAELWQRVRSTRRQSLQNSEELAEQWDWDAEEVLRLARVAAYLIDSARVGGICDEDAMAEIAGVIQLGTPDFKMHEGLRDLFSFTEQERTDALAKRAFSVPPTYLNVEIQPVFVPSSGDDSKLLGGFFLTLAYVDSEDETQSITFGVSGGELREIAEAIDKAEKELAKSSAGLARGKA